MNRALEFEHLRKAEHDIAKGRERIARQSQLIETLVCHGQDTTTAQAVLATMRHTLSVMEEHRLLIVKELEATDGEWTYWNPRVRPNPG
jgi:hypothetical protein